jgi:flagellar hook-length control protein FliK
MADTGSDMDISNLICSASNNEDSSINFEVGFNSDINVIEQGDDLDSHLFEFFMAQTLPPSVCEKQLDAEKNDDAPLAEKKAREPVNVIHTDQEVLLQNLDEISSLEDFENNVAIVWIDSDSFQQNLINQPSAKVIDTRIFDLKEKRLPEAFKSIDVEEVEFNNIGEELGDEGIPDHDTKTEFLNKKPIDNALSTISSSDSSSDKTQPIDIKKENTHTDLLPFASRTAEINAQQSMGYVNSMTSEIHTVLPETNLMTFEKVLDINDHNWHEQFSDQVVWLGQQSIKSALIKVHPEDLGPLEINVEVIKDTAHVSIATNNEQIRSIIEEALPRLKEMMADQGLSLADVSVGVETNSQESKHNNRDETEHDFYAIEQEHLNTPLQKISRGLVDYFA